MTRLEFCPYSVSLLPEVLLMQSKSPSAAAVGVVDAVEKTRPTRVVSSLQSSLICHHFRSTAAAAVAADVAAVDDEMIQKCFRTLALRLFAVVVVAAAATADDSNKMTTTTTMMKRKCRLLLDCCG